MIDLRLQESAAMLAVEAGGKKGGADLGGEVRRRRGGGCRTDGRLTPVERVEESTIEDGWCFDPRGRRQTAVERSRRRLTGREGRTRICHGKKENNNVGLFTGWMTCPLPREGSREAAEASVSNSTPSTPRGCPERSRR